MRLTKPCGGQERLFVFNMMALEKYAKNWDFERPTSAIYACIYAGLCAAAYVQKTDEPTFEQACQWADEMYDEKREDDIKEICDAWASTRVYEEWAAKLTKEAEKLFRTITQEPEKKKEKRKSNMTGSASTSSPLVN